MTYRIWVKTVSEANQAEHWRKRHKRRKALRREAWLATLEHCGKVTIGDGLRISLTRITPSTRRLDSDNLAMSLKSIRDGIADALGVDDGDERIVWAYEQCKEHKTWAVQVVIQAV